MKQIVAIQFGSHLYGTATPSSDLDFKAVCLPDAHDILLQRVKPTIVDNTKTDGAAKNTAEDTDRETWALHQFFKLVGQGQTVAMDVLFSTPSSWLGEPDPLWFHIMANRHRFLSRQVAAFLGYCRQQAARYGIRGSRVAAARSVASHFVALVDQHGTTARISSHADSLGNLLAMDHIEIATRDTPDGAKLDHISVCGRLVPVTASLKTARDTFVRLFDQYGERARQAERNEGVDWKALSHAVRVGCQAVELLSTGHMSFPRPEAKELVAIKTGRLAYAAVAERIEALLAEVEAAAQASQLPDQPDHAAMDAITVQAYRSAVLSS